jgi:replication-associated recombination protein RarA
VDQEYRPAAVADNRYYEPSDRGHEVVVAERLRRLRGGDDDSDASVDLDQDGGT